MLHTKRNVGSIYPIKLSTKRTLLLITGTNRKVLKIKILKIISCLQKQEHLHPSEASRPSGWLRPCRSIKYFYLESTTCGIFLRLWPPTLISASIQLQYSLTLITASPETASMKADLQAGTTRLLSTCNPLQIITDYWSDASRVVVITNESDTFDWSILVNISE